MLSMESLRQILPLGCLPMLRFVLKIIRILGIQLITNSLWEWKLLRTWTSVQQLPQASVPHLFTKYIIPIRGHSIWMVIWLRQEPLIIESQVAKLFGIDKLREEKSKSISTGITYRIPKARLSFTLDAYFIRVDDRIVLTETFSRPSSASTPSAVSLQQLLTKQT